MAGMLAFVYTDAGRLIGKCLGAPTAGKVASIFLVLSKAVMRPTGGGSPEQGPGREPLAAGRGGQPCSVFSPTPRGVLGWAGEGRRMLWNSCISAAVSAAWPLPKPLVPFFFCSTGTFPEPNYSTPQLQEVIEYPTVGLSIFRRPEPAETPGTAKHQAPAISRVISSNYRVFMSSSPERCLSRMDSENA